MRLKNRLFISFITVTILPVVLLALCIMVFGYFQINTIEDKYGLTEITYENLSNPVQTLSRLTEREYAQLAEKAEADPRALEDARYLDEVNQVLKNQKSYLLVRKEEAIIFSGAEAEQAKAEYLQRRLPRYGDHSAASKSGLYFGGEVQSFVKQIDFQAKDGSEASAFIITDASEMIPEVEEFIVALGFAFVVILVLTAVLLMLWIYQSVDRPLAKMQKAAQNIKDGNLDFELAPETDDEFGQLCHAFEEMRKHLKENAEEKLAYDRENKELISNISHDLKTPVTTIKGYAEGIMDGVADTPEKMDKYIRTIYNKANEMNILINELTLYAQIDTNRIPYNFTTMSASAYFGDCAEELAMEMEAKNVEFAYFNYVDRDVKIIVDPEQIRRVVNNIVANSLKYMDKEQERINLRLKDVGDFVQVELEDNGKGMAAKDLPHIFDRFYRTDASRNSSKGGSGIGLSIVKKIVEEHGGKIWAASREGTGTVMYFVIRKYQEVPAGE